VSLTKTSYPNCDTIIVFYAGHGTAYYSRGALPSAGRVKGSERVWNSFYRNRVGFEYLCPNRIDAIVPADGGLPDSADPVFLGRAVPDICDRELSTTQ